MKLSPLRTFGYIFEIHIDSNDHIKFDAKSRKCYFISYRDELFGYCFWDDQSLRIIKGRNLILMKILKYDDKSSTTVDAASHEFEFMGLDELPYVTVGSRDVSDGERVGLVNSFLLFHNLIQSHLHLHLLFLGHP